MYILFVINLFLYIFLECYYPIYLSKKVHLKLINPITIVAYSAIPITLFKVFIGPFFILENSLMDKYFNFAILMTNIALIGKFVLTKYSFFFFEHNKTTMALARTCMPHWKIRRSRTLIASSLILLMGVLCFILVASHSFGLFNWILDSRTGYQYHRTGAGHFYSLAILFYTISFSLFSIFLKKNRNVFICFFFYFVCVYLLGSKDILLSFVVSGLVFLWFRKYKHLRKAIFGGIPCAFILMLLNFGSISFSEIAQYFDYYINSAMYFEEYFKGGIDLFYGEIYWSSFWEVIPRFLYPEKPHVYGILLINEHFFPGLAESTHTPAFGGPLSAFADWGVIGVFLASFINFSSIFELFLYFYLFKFLKVQKLKSSPPLIYCVILLFAPSFMKYVGFPLNFILWIFIVKFVSCHNRITLKSNKHYVNI